MHYLYITFLHFLPNFWPFAYFLSFLLQLLYYYNINYFCKCTHNINGDIMRITDFKKIYYEKDVVNYKRGKFLLNKYSDIPQTEIASHNNIPELRAYENKDFTKLKQYLILGTRKTHKYNENHKISDFLVPFTSSGCSAMCQYCYLVCNYNKCSYLRIFVNKEDILNNLIKNSQKYDRKTVYEIGSNSDLLLENIIDEDLQENIEYFFKSSNKGILTFPTKFNFVEPLLNISSKDRLIPRMSLNPQDIITRFEIGTSSLVDRLHALNTLCEAGYSPYILIAPIILVENYKKHYEDLIITMKDILTKKAKKNITFEIIFMTYSYIHDKINTEAFPNSTRLYSKELMASRGIGKYHYKDNVKEDARVFIEDLLNKNFKNYSIKYIV